MIGTRFLRPNVIRGIRRKSLSQEKKVSKKSHYIFVFLQTLESKFVTIY